MDYRQLKTILLVEDNEDHIEHTVDALYEGGLVNKIIVIKDGKSALEYMYRQGEYSNPKKSPRPCIILLDVKLPKMTGFEILKTLKNDPELKVIPIILLTTTCNKEDIERGARLGVNDYIVKPVEFDSFMHKVKGLGKYWALISNLTNN